MTPVRDRSRTRLEFRSVVDRLGATEGEKREAPTCGGKAAARLPFQARNLRSSGLQAEKVADFPIFSACYLWYTDVVMSIRLEDLASSLDRSGPVPLYYQIKQWLTSRVVSGELVPGTQLPDEFEIGEQLGVSRGVVRQALTELCYEGLLYRQRGRGTFVSTPKTAEGLISGLRGLADDALLRGQKIESKVLVLREVPADETVARNLSIAPGEPVVELERVRSLNGEPHVLVTTYLPASQVPGIVDKDLNGTASLYKVLREDYNVSIAAGVRRVEATVAGARESSLLRVKRGSPLLVLRSVGYTSGKRPIDYFVAFHRGDRSAFEVELSNPIGFASRFHQVPVGPEGLLASGSL